jgi:hypothetical protein
LLLAPAADGRGHTLRPPRARQFIGDRRPVKTVGFDLAIGGSMKPLLTPDHPDAFEQVVRAHVDPSVIRPGARRSSIV